MLTLFTMPKPFEGHFGVIQRNAVKSWMLLNPAPEIILFGNEEGTAETCSELGVRHGPEVARNEFGTPLLDDLFEQAQRLANNDLLCYVNADVILINDFIHALEQAEKWRRHYLMIGRRWDVEIKKPWDFDGDNYETDLKSLAQETGKLRSEWSIDYFVFRKGLYSSVPPFAIGRTSYDNWLIWNAFHQKVPIVDATPRVIAIHQDHDYSHARELKGAAKKDEFTISRGAEADRNRELVGNRNRFYNTQDAAYSLIKSGIRRNLSIEHLRRRFRFFRRNAKKRARSMINRTAGSTYDTTRKG